MLLKGLGPAIPGLVFLLMFFLVPLLILLSYSVTDPVPGLGNYAELLANGRMRGFWPTPSWSRAS